MGEDAQVAVQWSEWNSQGFLPGPEESETAFKERIAYCLNLENNLDHVEGAKLSLERDHHHSEELLEKALPLSKKLYGIEPKWVPLFFDNQQLAPWHGGCAWIFQLNDQTPTASFLQLRSHFRHASTFLGLYPCRELISHEMAHVGRMLYQEPKFEEFFAYQSSSSKLTRWLGPIVQSSRESFFFILLLGFVVLAEVSLIATGTHMPMVSWGLKLLPLLFIVYALARLIYRHHILKRGLRNLSRLYSHHQAKHFLYRLRDDEIKLFSRSNSAQIREFIDHAAQDSFRWRFLKVLYPPTK